MARRVVPWVPALIGSGLALVAALAVIVLADACDIEVEAREERPNVVWIIVDDLDVATFHQLPVLETALASRGVAFTESFVTASECCPSRASSLRGQYPHNHGVMANVPPNGGFSRFSELDRERCTLATWLDDAGYDTALYGKYLVGYGDDPTARMRVPPGWDDWRVRISGGYRGWTGNINGQPAEFRGRDSYETDVIAGWAGDYIRQPRSNPYLLVLAPYAPHRPAIPPLRYRDAFRREILPRPPAFDENDISDKPDWLQAWRRLTHPQLDRLISLYRDRLATMLAVEELVEHVLTSIEQSGAADRTWLIFTSDNGHHIGLHRLLDGKSTAYEEDIRVPLVVIGPGAQPGTTIDAMVLNQDLPVTIAELAGVMPPTFVDGRSLVGLLAGDVAEWRTGFLAELERAVIRPRWRALRLPDALYVEWGTGEREYYDLRLDPFQMENRYAELSSEQAQALADALWELAHCHAESCRAAEAALPP